MDEKIIGTQAVYAGRVIRLDVHQVELPNGAQSQREILTHPGAVAIVALDAEQHVLLVRQFRLAASRVMIEIPAGTRELGEDIFVCAERELREETGQRPLKLEHLGGFFVAPGYTTEYIDLFLAQGCEAAPLAMDADEQISVERVPLYEALKMVEDGRIIDAKSAVGLLRVARRLGLV